MKIVRLVGQQLLLVAIVMAALMGVDRLAGRLVPALKLAKQLFPPHSELSIETPEFAYDAHINGQGFRDREFGPPTLDRIRVVAIGDSFTYGWGVQLDSAWVKLLENSLREHGLAIEIANLGKPGSGPAEYAQVAQAAVDVLRPDLVLVALQQTDDLQQAVLDPAFIGLLKSLRDKSISARAEDILRRAFPNFLLLLSGRTVENVNWGPTVARVLAILPDNERRRFENLDPEVRSLFLAGALNPGLLVIASKAPSYYVGMTDPQTPNMRARLDAIVAQLSAIKRAASQTGADVIVVSVPNRAYVSEADLANVKRLGFATQPGMVDWSSPDDVIRDVASRVGLRAVIVTENFRRACREKRCYYTFDDHLNATGHRILAELVTGVLYDMLDTTKGDQ